MEGANPWDSGALRKNAIPRSRWDLLVLCPTDVTRLTLLYCVFRNFRPEELGSHSWTYFCIFHDISLALTSHHVFTPTSLVSTGAQQHTDFHWAPLWDHRKHLCRLCSFTETHLNQLIPLSRSEPPKLHQHRQSGRTFRAGGHGPVSICRGLHTEQRRPPSWDEHQASFL